MGLKQSYPPSILMNKIAENLGASNIGYEQFERVQTKGVRRTPLLDKKRVSCSEASPSLNTPLYTVPFEVWYGEDPEVKEVLPDLVVVDEVHQVRQVTGYQLLFIAIFFCIKGLEAGRKVISKSDLKN